MGRLRAAILIPAVGLALVFASSCAPKALYDWGSYEDGLYRSMVKSGDPQAQADRLSADVQKILSRGRRVPPGVRAHLGYLYARLGRVGEARAEFEAEKAAFPESTVFIDGMIARMGQAAGVEPQSAAAAAPTPPAPLTPPSSTVPPPRKAPPVTSAVKPVLKPSSPKPAPPENSGKARESDAVDPSNLLQPSYLDTEQ